MSLGIIKKVPPEFSGSLSDYYAAITAVAGKIEGNGNFSKMAKQFEPGGAHAALRPEDVLLVYHERRALRPEMPLL